MRAKGDIRHTILYTGTVYSTKGDTNIILIPALYILPKGILGTPPRGLA
jgi:hypothetical protein